MEAIWDSANFWAARQMLDGASRAQEVYASNLAHVNTPGYQRREVSAEFHHALRSALLDGSAGPNAKAPQFKAVIDKDAAPNSPSGNSTALTREMQALQSNALSYQFLTRYAGGRFGSMRMAITGRT